MSVLLSTLIRFLYSSDSIKLGVKVSSKSKDSLAIGCQAVGVMVCVFSKGGFFIHEYSKFFSII
jgi:hypothetical protein